jgi:hypothetical protein
VAGRRGALADVSGPRGRCLLPALGVDIAFSLAVAGFAVADRLATEAAGRRLVMRGPRTHPAGSSRTGGRSVVKPQGSHSLWITIRPPIRRISYFVRSLMHAR